MRRVRTPPLHLPITLFSINEPSLNDHLCPLLPSLSHSATLTNIHLGKQRGFHQSCFWFFGRGESPELVKRNMKIWVMFSLVGCALLFFSAGRTTSNSDLHVNCQVDEMANTAEDDIFPVISEPWSISLEDYQPADPSPSSKRSVKPGPIQHGAPLMPYLPIPNPTPPASPPERHG